MWRRSYVKGKDLFNRLELTDFGKEVAADEISWWVHKKETEHEELLKRTKKTLISVQKLKEDFFILKERLHPTSYPDLIMKIKDFTEAHDEEIRELHDYVHWLYEKDALAPSILFTYRVWGSTRLSDRSVMVTANAIDVDIEIVKRCTEFALGLRSKFGYYLNRIYLDILSDIVDSTEPEYLSSISVPQQTLLNQTSYKILDELADYFEFLRQSLRNIILEIEKFNEPTELLHRESFWRSFIKKSMDIRIESQLWDFKETLEMWHDKKEDAKVRFCEQIAALANTTGGVLIVGITNKFPRKVLGIDDLENKLKTIVSIIKEHTNYYNDFIHIQPIQMKDEEDHDKMCLIIAVAQTKFEISVKDESNKLSYPTRLVTGFERVDAEKIKNAKLEIRQDNYNFISRLYNLTR